MNSIPAMKIIRTPEEMQTAAQALRREGEIIGFVAAGVKEVRDTNVGDTVTDALRPAAQPLPGYKEAKSMVFSGLYPIDSKQYEDLKEAVIKLRLNDASFSFTPETSLALGFGCEHRDFARGIDGQEPFIRIRDDQVSGAIERHAVGRAQLPFGISILCSARRH